MGFLQFSFIASWFSIKEDIDVAISSSDPSDRESCGLNVKAGDPEDMASALIKLKNNPDLRQRISMNAVHIVAEQFETRVLATEMIERIVATTGKN